MYSHPDSQWLIVLCGLMQLANKSVATMTTPASRWPLPCNFHTRGQTFQQSGACKPNNEKQINQEDTVTGKPMGVCCNNFHLMLVFSSRVMLWPSRQFAQPRRLKTRRVSSIMAMVYPSFQTACSLLLGVLHKIELEWGQIKLLVFVQTAHTEVKQLSWSLEPSSASLLAQAWHSLGYLQVSMFPLVSSLSNLVRTTSWQQSTSDEGEPCKQWRKQATPLCSGSY